MIDQSMVPYLTAIVESIEDAVLAKTFAGIITYWNPGAEVLYGYSASEMVGRHISLLFPAGLPREFNAIMRRLEHGERIKHFETVLVAKSGKRIDVSLTISPLFSRRGELIGALTIARDNSDRRRAEHQLSLHVERLALATAVARIGVWEWELSTDQLTWDATMLAMYGFEPTDRITYENWAACVHSEDLPGREASLRRVVEQNLDGSGEFRIVSADGGVKIISFTERAVLDGAANVVRVVGVNVDVTERRAVEAALRKSQEQMKYLAEHDFLTGLPNQRILNDRIGQAIELGSRTGRTVALLFLDMDGFKHINDSLGHPAGDKLIQSISKRLLDCVRSSDTVSRQGGDEFIVLLPEVNHPEDTAIAARRMLEAVAAVHSVDEHELQITACIGISIYPDDGLDAETLIKNADTAMYNAKDNGTRGYEFFQPAMNLRAVERQFLEEGMRQALERAEFVLHYQPKIDLRTGAITGAEALIRWMHPTRGLLYPGNFIPIAEASGLIIPIGAWVLRQACIQAQSWIGKGLPPITMAVNVSPVRFESEGFLEGLFAILNETGLDKKSVEIEVTETLLIRRPELTASILRTLRETGVRIAMDDLGTGYSSLSYLHNLPLDALKIDQSFVRQISMAPNQIGIVSAIILMGKSLNLKLIAEGIETAEELKFLQDLNCDEGQGYYFSPPVLPEQFARLHNTGGFRIFGDAARTRSPLNSCDQIAREQERDRRRLS
ncbi:diguanylate cyclase/phosphodiesterase (GGDEF & EAL domains) with PAS/PAC sensor(s) [Acidisarcina polymorpha]|uniref:Diguanylate cyclase/phosphodiesterase (GGDEF & EAL domains) with PAS/PAC sensor(S) n=1 Tax=Acidisarcina polymorpha TaxID=2211140 RepID=A0A2Z5G4S8_9BACT|nr:GGDEF domain-containing phosphodiesterase [Acidisarcina polymorpha]AXC14029.1 diguanylate cyclase/phosphodiesterase (GGDEF & EAL domains) with PAS/PAC sensor(s) [Acidisarcina polymorpha]